MPKYRCSIWQYLYDPAIGDATNGTPVQTTLEDIAEDWTCPNGGVDKSLFEPFIETR
ncbi:rubredoxin [Desulfuromonas acetoxidans]|uniref:rubredoxin n=1 Tax=Desulfuromonas acetoxidans TaxID=891 RepID=UPI00292DAFB6|nr:rubredoxin [Desulfuromonas acetoxidans]